VFDWRLRSGIKAEPDWRFLASQLMVRFKLEGGRQEQHYATGQEHFDAKWLAGLP
jgi:hypothetical protein